MSDFLVAVGLVLAFEGVLFAAFPVHTKRAMASAVETPEGLMRAIGLASAVLGVIIVWLIRG
jgi:uncharacterized protein YjeT (DUF2065 family)